MTMVGRCLASSDALANIKRGFNAHVRSSSEVFRGGQISLDVFNIHPKQKPFVIKEGGLLNNIVKPVVLGKGKEVFRDDEFLSPKIFLSSSSCKDGNNFLTLKPHRQWVGEF